MSAVVGVDVGVLAANAQKTSIETARPDGHPFRQSYLIRIAILAAYLFSPYLCPLANACRKGCAGLLVAKPLIACYVRSEGITLRALFAKLIADLRPGTGCSETHGLTPTLTSANRLQLTPSDASRENRLPTRRAATPREHAASLLEMLQGPGGRTGTITADELKLMHREVCLESDFEEIGWVAVGRELRRLLNDRKSYNWVDGRRLRVYRIPPATPIVHWKAA